MGLTLHELRALQHCLNTAHREYYKMRNMLPSDSISRGYLTEWLADTENLSEKISNEIVKRYCNGECDDE